MIGGMQSEKSEIKIGDDCVVLYRSYLNTTRKILLGNNVGVGGYCLIFTHSAWQNVLDGNPYKFADILINDNVWLPWNVTVMPGITIGKDVTVGSGSVITKNLPPRVFAAGVPAKILQRKDIGKISKENKKTIVLEILSDFQGYASNFLKLRIFSSKDSHNYVITSKNQRLVFVSNFKKLQKSDVAISFNIPKEIKQKYQWIELDSLDSNIKNTLAKQFILFVRRYGIKIKAGPLTKNL